MAFERIGLGGILTFDERQAVQATGKARDALGRFVKTSQTVPPAMAVLGVSVSQAFGQIAKGTRTIGAGVKQMGAGLARAAIGFAPLAVALHAGVSTAAGFEKQMSAVGAITRASSVDMERLTSKAEEMGIVSVFSAQQAGEAMEFMGRSGASTDEIIGGLQGVMAAAAAETIDLATASDLVAQATKIMGREWTQASNTADILALTSASTNTNMIALGEALRFGGQSAADMGYSLEETAATMGILANAGLRGSIGGTALMNMFNKITKPSAKARKQIDAWGISLTGANNEMRSMADIVAQFKMRIDAIPNAANRAGVITELFGIRGKRAFQALSKAGPAALKKLVDAMYKASDGIGAAQEAAIKRLDNFSGAFTLFSSSLQAASIKIFRPLLEPLKEGLSSFTGALNSVLLPLGAIRRSFEKTGTVGDTLLATLKVKFGNTAVDIAMGVNDAINSMMIVWGKLTSAIGEASTWFKNTFGEESTRSISKWVVLIGIAAGAIAPLFLALVGVSFAVGGIISAASGLIAVFSGVFTIATGIIGGLVGLMSGPVVLAIIGIAGAFYLLRDTIADIWNGIKSGLAPAIATIGDVWDDTMGDVIMSLQFAWSEIKTTFNDLFGVFFKGTSSVNMDWVVLGKGLIGIAATMVSIVIRLVGYMIQGVALAAGAIAKVVSVVFNGFMQSTTKIVRGILDIFQGDFVDGMWKIGTAIFDVLTAPLRSVIEQVLNLVSLIPGASDIIPQGLIDFMEHGFGTFDMPKPQIQGDQNKTQDLLSDQADGIMELKAAEKQRAQEQPNIEVKSVIEDKRTLNIDNKLCVEGEQMSIARERHKQEVQERAGFKATPWQRRVAIEQGAAPVGRGSL